MSDIRTNNNRTLYKLMRPDNVQTMLKNDPNNFQAMPKLCTNQIRKMFELCRENV